MEELTLLNIARDFGIAFVVGFCWAILFGSPKRLLWVAGLLGGMGHCIRFVLIQLDFGLITATLAGSVLIGLVGIYAAHKVDSPPVVFTMPACITMIPGMFAGWLQEQLGYNHFFIWVMICSIIPIIAVSLLKINPNYGKATDKES